MLGNRKLILDTSCEVHDLLKPWSDGEFYDLNDHTLVPNAIYVIGRHQFVYHRDIIRKWVESDTVKVVLSNPAEGSKVLKWHCESMYRCDDLIMSGQMLLIGGGDMHPEWNCLQYDSFLPMILDYEENLNEIQKAQNMFQQTQKPYKFLFLNGISTRNHRKWLIEKFDCLGLLDQSIWSWLHSHSVEAGSLTLEHNGQNLMIRPRSVHLLDSRYEVDKLAYNIYQRFDNNRIKYSIHGQFPGYGYIYFKAEPYMDTYFSVVTETVFDYPYSFRTEKIWKPIAMGHPFVVASNVGYLRDLRNMGFQTFGHVIDESYDTIDNDQQRLERIANVVRDLCQQDLASFQKECYNVCEHNQQHLAAMKIKVRAEFPDRFRQFVRKYRFDE